ncbi:MAG: metalloregulator ArsR/SmtB family transcription factor [Deltaproteobacteria bacterium]|nr:metalloregulator ArsR/SmtB family transcription factor [Deltaproteobacteria bacterium]
MLNLQSANDLCRLLGDPTRIRLLALLAHEELTVAELTQVTGLAQSRVSTHLGKLKDADMVHVRKSGPASFYGLRVAAMPEHVRRFWQDLEGSLDDPTLGRDLERARALVAARAEAATWADSVAGQMQRHYSPGRTWESFTRGLVGLLRLGHVLDVASGDGALSELVAPRADSVTCVDVSPTVVDAGRQRLLHLGNVRFVQGDMHALPLPDQAFDQVLLMNALTYARDAAQVLREAARVLRPGGDLVLTTLDAHAHADAVAAYDHVNLGFSPRHLQALLEAAGLEPTTCQVTHEETRAPHFRVITAQATRRPAGLEERP